MSVPPDKAKSPDKPPSAPERSPGDLLPNQGPGGPEIRPYDPNVDHDRAPANPPGTNPAPADDYPTPEERDPKNVEPPIPPAPIETPIVDARDTETTVTSNEREREREQQQEQEDDRDDDRGGDDGG